MFGLLKKKIKGFTDKVFGKTQEKSEEETNQIKQEGLEEIEKVEDQEIKQFDHSLEEKIKKEDKVIDKEIKEDVLEPLNKDLKKEKGFEKEIKDFKEAKDLKKENQDIKEEIKEDVLEPLNKDLKKEEEKIKEDLSSIKDDSTLTKEPLIENAPSGFSLTKKDLENIKKPRDLEDSSSAYQELTREQKEIKRGGISKFKSLFSSKIKLSEKEISEFLGDFEFSLLEADVSIDSAQAIIEVLKNNLVNSTFLKNNLLENIKEEIKKALLELLDVDCNINNYIIKDKKDDPLIVLIIGPNGAGKTTTIAKLANKFKKQNKTIVLSSSDTFRAGSIDQLNIHSERLGVKIIKQKYGADPAAVAFDAVASAKAHNNDVVLIDTAGRQDTNINLMQELFKIKRVVKPHLTLYIAESQSGQAIVEQIEKFNKEIGITGVILTKLDTDPKGGTAISILHDLKKPIFYVGTGQEYDDLEDFSSQYIVDRIV